MPQHGNSVLALAQSMLCRRFICVRKLESKLQKACVKWFDENMKWPIIHKTRDSILEDIAERLLNAFFESSYDGRLGGRTLPNYL